MSNDLNVDIVKSLRSHDDRYDYFLLAVAGASIAFALNQTKGMALAPSQVPLGIAVLSWALSFFTGCLRLGKVRHALYLNGKMLEVLDDPIVRGHPQGPAVIREAAHKSFHKADDRAVLWGRFQFFFLIAGAVAYIAWHVTEMYLKTVKH